MTWAYWLIGGSLGLTTVGYLAYRFPVVADLICAILEGVAETIEYIDWDD